MPQFARSKGGWSMSWASRRSSGPRSGVVRGLGGGAWATSDGPAARHSASSASRDTVRNRGMKSGVEKVDSKVGDGQHRGVARPRQLRAHLIVALGAACAAAPLVAQQDQRVVRGLAFEGNRAIDDYTLSTAIATSNSSFFASVWWLRWMGFLGEKRYLNEVELRRDVVRLLLLYRQSGYMSAVIDTLVRREGNDVFIRFRIMEGDPVRLERLRITRVGGIPGGGALKKGPPPAGGAPLHPKPCPASGH